MVLVIMVNPMSVLVAALVVTGMLFGWRYGGLLPLLRNRPEYSLRSVENSEQGK